jgi:chromosome partitioning protein
VGESVGLAIGSLGGCGATVVHGSGSSFGLCFDLDPDQQQRLGQQLAQLVSGSGGNGSAIAEATTEPAPAAMGHTAAASARAVVVDPKWLADLPSPAANGERQGAPVAPPDAAIRGKTIVLGNLKGGTGKTTLAMHLSVALLRAGYTVGCVDLDSGQATLSRYLQNRLSFARDRGMDLPMPAVHLTPPADDGELRARLGDLKGRADVILVDTPGGNTPLSRAAHEAADLLITPINDSFVDVDVLARLAADSLAFADLGPYGELIRQIRATKRENGASPLAWIVIRNRLSALDARNKRDMHDALCHLAHRLDFELAAGLSERVLYRELFLHGLTVLDLRTEDTGIPLTLSHVAARQELRTLLQHVLAD